MGRSDQRLTAQFHRLIRSRFEASLDTLLMDSTCSVRSSDESWSFRSSEMTSWSHESANNTTPSNAEMTSVLSRTPSIIRAPKAAEAATDTQAARVKDRMRPTERTTKVAPMLNFPMAERPGFKKSAKAGNQNMASTAP